MTGVQILVEMLRQYEVEVIFGVPGGPQRPLLCGALRCSAAYSTYQGQKTGAAHPLWPMLTHVCLTNRVSVPISTVQFFRSGLLRPEALDVRLPGKPP